MGVYLNDSSNHYVTNLAIVSNCKFFAKIEYFAFTLI